MAVTVTDTRTILTQADSTVSWSGDATPQLTTTATEYAESSGAISMQLNESEGSLWFNPASSINVTTNLLYVWTANTALQGGWDDGGAATIIGTPHGLYLSDGTDTIVFFYAGNDKYNFRHEDTQTMYQCFLFDGDKAGDMDTDGLTYALAGAYSTLDLTAITDVGVYFETLSKALGGGVNTFVDIIRYGNNGLTITGGGTGTEGKFTEIVTEDKSKGDTKAHGIIREYSTGIFGLQGPLTFGAAVTGSLDFDDDGVVLAFENRAIDNDKYFFNVVGPSASGTTSFVLTNSTITTAGPYVTCDFSDAGIGTLTITGSTFSGLNNSISFANDASASGHTITGNTFNVCGQIDPGDVTFENNTIQATTAGTTGALLLDADGVSNWADLDFISGGTGHAIYMTAAATYTFDNFTYSGYGGTPGSNLVVSSGSTDAMVYNNSGSLVTINISGGDTPSIRNGAGATTVVNNTKTITINVYDQSTAAVEGAQVWIQKQVDDTDYGHPGKPFTSATGNSRGDADFVVTSGETVPGDLPSSGWITVQDISTGEEQAYRFASRSGQTFTFNAQVTGTDNGTGNSTTINETNIGTKDIVEGDTIYNSSSPFQWATVLSVSTNSVTTTELSASGSWSGLSYSVHRLALDYVSATDTATVPLMNEETNASGVATESYNFGASKPVIIRVRLASGGTDYLPFGTTATITGDFTLDVTLLDDDIKT